MVSFLIPFESALGETRVSATPETVKKFLDLGCKVFVEKGTKAAGGRARKAIGEIKKLVTGYRQASVSESK